MRAVLAALAALLLSGCASSGGTSAGLFPSPYVAVNKADYSASVTVMPDAADPNLIAVQTRYESKTGELPDMAFHVEKPSPNVVVGTAHVRINRLTTPVQKTIEK